MKVYFDHSVYRVVAKEFGVDIEIGMMSEIAGPSRLDVKSASLYVEGVASHDVPRHAAVSVRSRLKYWK